MKILFVTDLYPIKAGETTTALTLHNFVIEWKKMGIDVDVIKPNFIFNSFVRQKPFYKTGFYDYNGVEIFNVNYHSPFLFDIEKKLPKKIKISDYDCIVAHMPSGIIFANKLAQKYKKPLVSAVHISDIEVLTNPIYKVYFKSELLKAYENSKLIAARSPVLKNKIIELLPQIFSKVFEALSGVDIEIQKKTFEPKQIYTVLTCANLIKRKNIDKLILAAKTFDNIKLKIIGDGKELKTLKRLAEGTNTEFLGRLENKKVIEEMKNSDIFILPSINETFGVVYLEAMASGCITVCTKDDGVAGIIIDGQNGFLTEPTKEGIENTLKRIFQSNDLNIMLQNSLSTIKAHVQPQCALRYIDKIELLRQ